MSGVRMLSTASRQIWPQIHAVLHIRPSRVLLLHSRDERESRRPAERLRDMLAGGALPFLERVELREVPDDDMDGARVAVTGAIREVSGDAVVHFTGGNKLMSTGAFLAAIETGARSCYLERRLQLCWFEAQGGGLVTRVEPIDPHQADGLDAVALLRCQIDGVEIAGQPSPLALRNEARGLDEGVFGTKLFQMATEWIQPAQVAGGKGENLEVAVAVAVLRFGPGRVYRGVRIQTIGAASDQTDLDILFNWGGHLWIVDCKDKTRHEKKLKVIEKFLPAPGAREQDLNLALGQLRRELESTHYILLKQALFDVQQGGGLQGRLVVVRRSDLPGPVEEYARLLGVPVLTKSDLVREFRRLLC